jgi:hypothetical protein
MGLGMIAVMTALGYECHSYRRGGGRWPIGELDRLVAGMLECDINLCYCLAR